MEGFRVIRLYNVLINKQVFSISLMDGKSTPFGFEFYHYYGLQVLQTNAIVRKTYSFNYYRLLESKEVTIGVRFEIV